MFKPAGVLLGMVGLSFLLGSCAPRVSEATILQARVVDSPLVITRISASRPNSVGGIDMDVDAINVSARVIKYVIYTVQLFNSVGDPVDGRIRNSSTRRLETTGPYRPGQSISSVYWPAALYSDAGRCIEVVSIEVTYGDDTVDTVSGERLAASLARNVKNDCGVDL